MSTSVIAICLSEIQHVFIYKGSRRVNRLFHDKWNNGQQHQLLCPVSQNEGRGRRAPPVVPMPFSCIIPQVFQFLLPSFLDEKKQKVSLFEQYSSVYKTHSSI